MTKKIIFFSLLISLFSASLQCMEEDQKFKETFNNGRNARNEERKKSASSQQPATPRPEKQSQTTTTTTIVPANITTTQGSNKKRRPEISDDELEKFCTWQTVFFSKPPAIAAVQFGKNVNNGNHPAAIFLAAALPSYLPAQIVKTGHISSTEANAMIKQYEIPAHINESQLKATVLWARKYPVLLDVATQNYNAHRNKTRPHIPSQNTTIIKEK